VKHSKKLPTTASQIGLSNPFANLDGSNLPPPPTQPSSNQNQESSIGDEESVRKLGRVVLRREKASRGGKTVIVIYDFPLTFHNKAMEELARTLRKECGTGGTVRDRTIEIQGDQPAKIRSLLEAKGFRVAGVT